MTPPRRYLARMALFLALVGGLAAALGPELASAFAANPLINAIILGVVALGIVWNLRQVLALRREVAWVEAVRASPAPDTPDAQPTRLLAPLATLLAARRGDRPGLPPAVLRGVLDAIASRLDEARELSRYVTGLSIFLGLLGTFWGLLETIGAVAGVINDMSVGSGDITQLFAQLKDGLAQPLRGMGTAFSASMLGLAGALVLGFLDLTAGQAQNRFYNDLEEWLAAMPRAGGSGGLGMELEGAPIPAYVQALLEQTAENLDALQRILLRGEEARVAGGAALQVLTERLALLTDQMRAGQALLLRVAEQPAVGEAVVAQLRAIELHLARLVEQGEPGRATALTELRSDLKVLSRTMAALPEAPPR